MIINTDLLIIDHLIYVFVTLPYLHLVFRHLNSLPYLISNLNKYSLLHVPNVVSKKSWMGDSVDPDVTPRLRVYTVCSGLSESCSNG